MITLFLLTEKELEISQPVQWLSKCWEPCSIFGRAKDFSLLHESTPSPSKPVHSSAFSTSFGVFCLVVSELVNQSDLLAKFRMLWNGSPNVHTTAWCVTQWLTLLFAMSILTLSDGVLSAFYLPFCSAFWLSWGHCCLLEDVCCCFLAAKLSVLLEQVRWDALLLLSWQTAAGELKVGLAKLWVSLFRLLRPGCKQTCKRNANGYVV